MNGIWRYLAPLIELSRARVKAWYAMASQTRDRPHPCRLGRVKGGVHIKRCFTGVKSL
jgi:hypothetical protein